MGAQQNLCSDLFCGIQLTLIYGYSVMARLRQYDAVLPILRNWIDTVLSLCGVNTLEQAIQYLTKLTDTADSTSVEVSNVYQNHFLLFFYFFCDHDHSLIGKLIFFICDLSFVPLGCLNEMFNNILDVFCNVLLLILFDRNRKNWKAQLAMLLSQSSYTTKRHRRS